MSREDLPSGQPFFGKKISPAQEKKEIDKILSKYRCEPVSEELKKKIYTDLVEAKENGKINIPFKVVLRRDLERHQTYIEILLETKV